MRASQLAPEGGWRSSWRVIGMDIHRSSRQAALLQEGRIKEQRVELVAISLITFATSMST